MEDNILYNQWIVTTIISFLAFFCSLVSIAWNIWRDFVKDKIKISFSFSVGQLHNVKNENTGIFISFASEQDPIVDPKLLVSIVNTGRRNIVVSKIEFKKIKKIAILLLVDYLKKLNRSRFFLK